MLPPHDSTVFRLMFCAPNGGVAVGFNGVSGARNSHDDVCGVVIVLEKRLESDFILDSGPAELLDVWSNLERQIDILGDAVGHQIKLPIRRDECDGSLFVKLAQLDTLVEFDVINSNSSVVFVFSLQTRTISIF